MKWNLSKEEYEKRIKDVGDHWEILIGSKCIVPKSNSDWICTVQELYWWLWEEFEGPKALEYGPFEFPMDCKYINLDDDIYRRVFYMKGDWKIPEWCMKNLRGVLFRDFDECSSYSI